jgi:hypothetical protein
MSNTYVCTDCPDNCTLTTRAKRPEYCVDLDERANWRIESEDETRAREQTEALKYMDMDKPHRKP